MKPALIQELLIPYGQDTWEWFELGGSSFYKIFKLRRGYDSLFLKYADQSLKAEMLETEYYGMCKLGEVIPQHIPGQLHFLRESSEAALVMEFIDNSQNVDFCKAAEAIASLHSKTSEAFGFDKDNYLGFVPLRNGWKDEWGDFFVNHRLKPVLSELSELNFYSIDDLKLFERALEKVQYRLSLVKPKVSLIHGDFWIGNLLGGNKGYPYLIDPAVYYGHCEVDLAMASLFGHFEERFFNCYFEICPLEDDYPYRIKAYQWYYLLIHLRMFGKDYLGSTRIMATELCSEL